MTNSTNVFLFSRCQCPEMSHCLGLDLTIKTAELAAEFAELGGI